MESNADKIEDEHFQNSQLNDMMEKYQCTINKDIFYEEQRGKEAAREEVMKKKREERKIKSTGIRRW